MLAKIETQLEVNFIKTTFTYVLAPTPQSTALIRKILSLDGFSKFSFNLHNVVVSTSQVGTGDVNIDWRSVVVVESVDDESGASSVRVPVGGSDVGGVEAQSLTSCWVSASEKNKEHIDVSVE
jgi:hypothetical protein